LQEEKHKKLGATFFVINTNNLHYDFDSAVQQKNGVIYHLLRHEPQQFGETKKNNK
jgi:hypothetical protein